MQIVKKILNWLLTILITLVLIVSILVAVMSLTSKATGISTFFGYTVQVIQSDSMKGGNPEYEGGDFEKGDVIIGKATSFDETRTYSVGDIVTYKGILRGYEELGEQLICHRIVDVDSVNGSPVYQTQGDNRSISQVPDQDKVEDYIYSFDIGAYFHTKNYDGIVIKGVGKIHEFINSQLGFFLCILLPMIIFFLIVLVRFVINLINYKNAKEDEKREAEREKDKQELLKKYGITEDTPVASHADSTEKADTSGLSDMTAEQLEQFKQFMAFQNAQKAMKEQQPQQPSEDVEETPAESSDNAE